MAKNIEMNYKDESGYEILRPQTTCEMVIDLLNEDTKELMGLSPSDQADDAFRKVYLAQVLDGRALINFTVMGDDGTPCKGVQIESSQFCDANGNKTTPIETDDNGKASVFVDNISVQASISKYANLSDWSETIAVEFGKQYDKSITLTRYNFKKYTSSGNLKFSPEIVKVDTSLGGGGGGGGFSRQNSENGGAGGYSIIQENISFDLNTNYTFQIGSGGASASNRSDAENGGTTNFLSYTASGGEGAKWNSGSAPQGNGNGGVGGLGLFSQSNKNGGDGATFIYTSLIDQGLYGGGGGGGVEYNWASDQYKYPLGGSGGMPGGGKADDVISRTELAYNQTQGVDGLGGGGAGSSITYYYDYDDGVYSTGTKGGCGVLALRMYRQQDLPA